MTSNNQKAIMNWIQSQDQLAPIDIDLTLTCHEVQIVLANLSMNQNEIEDALDGIKRNRTSNNNVRVILRVINDLLTVSGRTSPIIEKTERCH
jgi:phosphoenolpyruvate carboxylase